MGMFIPMAHAQSPRMNQLYQLKDAKTRSISPENFTGEKGRGGMATLEQGSAARAARELGQGWKVNPYVLIEPGTTFTLGEIEDSGIINHIWMTPVGDFRLMILRFYWDGETEPSVEVPVGDFFASGWGMGNEPRITSLAVCVNPRSGFNSYWQMPFRKSCRVTLENIGDSRATVYYQIDYSLEQIAHNTPYFHAQFRRVNPLPYKEVFTILDGIQGRGHYVGTYLAHGANSEGWWGEGEIKFYIDGDNQFPTICGTGEEDYFCGSYGYNERLEGDREEYDNFSSPYTGFYHVRNESLQRRFGQYRWHITDPVRFEDDLRITIQSLGWQSEGRYLPLQDDLASVAYWYQLEPHNSFPPLPAKEYLVIADEFSLKGFTEHNVFLDETEVNIQGQMNVEEIHYTIDGTNPTLASTIYDVPFKISENVTVKARGFAQGKSITPILEGQFVRESPRRAVEAGKSKSGVMYQFVRLQEPLETTKALKGHKAHEEGVTESLALPESQLPNQFGMIFTGYVRIPNRGVYTFHTLSNDGSVLFIGDDLVVDNDSPHPTRLQSGQIALEPGLHRLRLEYFQAGGAKALEVHVEGPGMPKQQVPVEMLAH
jgi:hypothetical protein